MSNRTQQVAVEICILAGGLSTRMGRDKSRLRVEGKTLVTHIRLAADNSGLPVRVIRHDLVPRCGPLGGIFTALKTTRAEAVVFLACDMPFVTSGLIAKLVKRANRAAQISKPASLDNSKLGPPGVFTLGPEGFSFPFLLHKTALELVERQITAKEFSLQALAAKCDALMLRAPRKALCNLNTPEDLQKFARVANKKLEQH